MASEAPTLPVGGTEAQARPAPPPAPPAAAQSEPEAAQTEESEITVPELGVYFGMPFAQYLAIPALSKSSEKLLLRSPMDFWARTAWINPNADDDDTKAKLDGRAYHTRINEGADAFYKMHVADLEPTEHKDALVTNDEMKAALTKRGVAFKASARKGELVALLKENDPTVQIWEEMLRAHYAKHKGKTFLRAQVFREIEYAAAMIEKHPQLSRCFQGGYPEVAVIYEDPETGLPIKAMIDYLKVQMFTELKTFANQLARPIDSAIRHEIAARKYHIDVASYLEAIKHAKRMIRERGTEAVHGEVPKDWIDRFAATTEHTGVFVFQQKGIAPVARGKHMIARMSLDAARDQIAEARRIYIKCIETFGTDPWVDLEDITDITDEDIPPYIVE